MKLPPRITPRKSQYWAKQGYIDLVHETPGSGHPRDWSPAALRQLYGMALLRELGFEAPLASKVAREMARSRKSLEGLVTIDLGHGMVLHVNREEFLQDAGAL
jgi:hypothetical protein